MKRASLRVGAALLTTLALSCAGPSADTPREGHNWLRASPALRQQIEDQITRLPWTHGLERVEQIAWLAAVGEPAFERLLELCEDPRPDVAASAVAALGATRDSRLVEPLRAVRWRNEEDRSLRFERARALVRLGDWREVGELIEGLDSDDPWARAWCLAALREVTGQTLGFDAQAESAERAEAVARWRSWHAARSGEGILAKGE